MKWNKDYGHGEGREGGVGYIERDQLFGNGSKIDFQWA